MKTKVLAFLFCGSALFNLYQGSQLASLTHRAWELCGVTP